MSKVSAPLALRIARAISHWAFRSVWNTESTGADRVPTTGPVVLASNHVHLLDGLLLVGMAPRPLYVLVKQEMFHGLIGWILRSAEQIETDRTNGRSALTQGLTILRRGDGIGIFPEGERRAGVVGQARAGAAWLAVNGDAPVVPVAILGTRQPGKSKNSIPAFRSRFAIEFGEPMYLAGEGVPRRQAVEEGTEKIGTAIAELVAAASIRTGLVFEDGPSTAQ